MLKCLITAALTFLTLSHAQANPPGTVVCDATWACVEVPGSNYVKQTFPWQAGVPVLIQEQQACEVLESWAEAYCGGIGTTAYDFDCDCQSTPPNPIHG